MSAYRYVYVRTYICMYLDSYIHNYVLERESINITSRSGMVRL